jgi:phage tail P2-like protein
MNRALLPPNRTNLEAALADAGRFDLDPTPLSWLDDAERCPAAFLPWLAWERSVENFDAATTEEQQRALIRTSFEVHRHKGTVAAVRKVFRALGLGEVQIDEGNDNYRIDGQASYDGFATYGSPNGWAEYRVRIDKLLSVKQACTARALLADVAPARCWLWGIDFTGAELIYNDLAAYDGGYTYGVA